MARSPLHQLTRLEIVNAKAAVKPHTLSDGGRLYILIKPDGAKLWRWNYDFAGKTKTMALGGWPEVLEKERLTLLAANCCDRGLIRCNAGERREAKAQATFNADATFEAVAKSGSGSRKRTGRRTIWTRSGGSLRRTSIRGSAIAR
ncbi:MULTISPECIES: Arm DNA-binding domain-containing protein [unclassified Paraburkholderia]|uniref:Arm DNA-binding domain-containing protein n=1 Tax=unclassified Paraburkholderia TaxID=2615204 RepID=UPI0038B7721B